MTVWRIRATSGGGWVRELHDGAPVITAEPAEAATWPTEHAARTALDTIRNGDVPFEIVEGPA